MTKRVLISGGCGFLGVHLARKFLKSGFIVTLFDINPLDAKDLQKKVTVVLGDIRNKKDVEKVIKGQNYIVHAAAALPIQNSRKLIFDVNVNGTKNVLSEALKYKIKRVVYISSTAVYGVPKYLPEMEDTPLNPIGHYGKSKVAAEKLCKMYMAKGLEINILRPKTFLGPERMGVFELWFEAIYSGKSVFILGDGTNPYQLLSVSDLTDVIEKAMLSKTKNEIFNIGASEFGNWKSDLGVIISYAKNKAKIVGLPVLTSQIILSILEKLHLSPLSEWHYRTIAVPSYVSIRKAEKFLDWSPKESNSELLLKNYKWYEKNRNEIIGKVGTGHRVGWNFKILNIVKNIL